MSDTTDLENADLLVNGLEQVSETSTDSTDTAAARTRRRGVGLSTMLLSELQALASTLGITGTARMRKGELVAAIEARQAATNGASRAGGTDDVAISSADRADDQLPLAVDPIGSAAVPVGDPAPAGREAPPVAGQLPLLTADAEAPTAAQGEMASPAAAPAEPAVAEPVAVTHATELAGPVDEAAPVAVITPAESGPAEQPREDRPRRSASRPAGPPSEPAAATTGSPAAEVAAVESPVTDVPAIDSPAAESRVDPATTGSPTDAGTTDGGRPAREGRQRQYGDRQRGGGDGDRDRGDRGERAGGDRQRDRAAAADRGDSDRPGGDRDRGERTGGDRPRGDGDRPRGDGDRPRGDGDRDRGDRGERAGGDRQRDRAAAADRGDGDRQRSQGDGDRQRGQGDGDRGERPVAAQGDRSQGDRNQGDRGGQSQADRDDDGFDGSGRRRRGRFRDRNRRSRTDRFTETAEPVIGDDDVLLPVAGILDILDNYAFIRTSGYLTGPNDVYVSLAQVRRYGLRRGDAVTGAVRQPREGERRDKYNALVRLDTINGSDPEQARNRPEFTKLTPLYPQDRLRLETEPHLLTPRVIDLVMPIGKGQRALIVSPPKAGKTMILQAIANAITTNNPECHLMVVLVDERPEEVTDMQRSVKGEVIASTFDRPPSDHTTVAELSIERAKRLVELGHDVVVLLDSITRLGRAYNLAAPASGRILSGGVDSTALFPPKRFLGAARNIEHGGSLTILATALIETGSAGDTVIFEEFKGTGNAELVLSRKIADKRIFPAVDVDASGTRKEEILLAPDELAVIHKLRRVLHALDPQQALDLVLARLKETRTNVEFLMQVQKTTVGPNE